MFNDKIVGLVGINGSPTCGVETTWSENEEKNGYGEFIKILVKELEQKGYVLR